MITPVCLAKTETSWNVLATATSMMAELRPVSGKNTLRRAIPANTSDASKSKRNARSRRSRWCSWARRTRFDGGYGKWGAVRWRSRAEGKTESDGGGVPIYSRKERARCRQLTHELATELATCHHTRKRRKMIGGGSCVARAASREVALGWF